MRERSPRVWELIVEAGRDPVTGKRRQASRTFRGILRPRGHPGRHGGRLVAAGPGDRDRAGAAARDADRRARALGMKAYFGRTAAQLAELGGRGGPAHLSRREEEVPALVAEGLTNRQIAERLVISERTAQEPRPAHPHQARLCHPQPDRGVERPGPEMSSRNE